MMRPLADIEKEVILLRLRSYEYNLTHTATSLDIGLRTLQRKLKSYGYVPHKCVKQSKADLQLLTLQVIFYEG